MPGGYDPKQLVVNPMGIASGLIAATTYGSYTILSKRSLAKHSLSTTVLYALVFGSLLLAPLSPAEKRHDQFHTVSLIASIGMLPFMGEPFRLMAGPYVLPLPVGVTFLGGLSWPIPGSPSGQGTCGTERKEVVVYHVKIVRTGN